MEVSKRKSLRKRMRDLKRTLSRTDNPEIATQKEAKVEELKLMRKLVLKTTNLYGKYKTIRFFGRDYVERRKLERQLTRAQKDLEKNPEAAAKLQQVQADLSYVKNYPINYKYVSLFSESSDLTLKYRSMMRKHIQKSLARKAQHRENVLAEERTEEVEVEADDAFFAQDEEQTSAPFEAQLRAEDVEAEEPRGWKRPRDEYKQPGYEKDTVKRTHLHFQG
jgi:hypothetical protein